MLSEKQNDEISKLKNQINHLNDELDKMTGEYCKQFLNQNNDTDQKQKNQNKNNMHNHNVNKFSEKYSNNITEKKSSNLNK